MSIETDLDELAGNLPSAAKPKAAKEKPVEAKKTVRIVLEESDDIPADGRGLFVQHNGRPYYIPTSTEVDIPLYLKEILDHAVISMPDVDPRTRQIRGYRNRLKYSYRVVG